MRQPSPKVPSARERRTSRGLELTEQISNSYHASSGKKGSVCLPTAIAA